MVAKTHCIRPIRSHCRRDDCLLLLENASHAKSSAQSVIHTFKFRGSHVIYSPAGRGIHGVMIAGDHVTHMIIDPAATGQDAQACLTAYKQENPDCPVDHFHNCLTIASPSEHSLLAIPMNDDCTPVPILEVIRQNERRHSLKEALTDPSCHRWCELDLCPEVISAMRRHNGGPPSLGAAGRGR